MKKFVGRVKKDGDIFSDAGDQKRKGGGMEKGEGERGMGKTSSPFLFFFFFFLSVVSC